MFETIYQKLISLNIPEEQAREQARTMAQELAQELAQEYVPRTTTKVVTQTFASWTSAKTTANTVSRLEAIMAILQALGITVSPTVQTELTQFKTSKLEMLRRLGALMDSRWIPQRNAEKLQQLAEELGEKEDKPTMPAPNHDLAAELLADLSGLTYSSDNSENNQVTEEDEEIIAHYVGTPVVPHFEPLPEIADIDKIL